MDSDSLKLKVYFQRLYSNKKNEHTMLKLKTRKAAAKRYKVTGNGNFLRRHAFKGHLLRKKSNRQKRKLSQILCVSLNDRKSIKIMLPY